MNNPTPDPQDSPEGEAVRERRCGRCQVMFPGEPGQHATAQLGWWMCPPCHEALLGHQRVSRSG
jgi:hypothetical protein